MGNDEIGSSVDDRDRLENGRLYGTLMVVAGAVLMVIALLPGGLAAEGVDLLLRLLSTLFGTGYSDD